MFAIIQAAGWPIYPLLLASIIAVALIIERLIMLRQDRIIPAGLLDKAVAAYQKQGITPDLIAKLASDSPLGINSSGPTKNGPTTNLPSFTYLAMSGSRSGRISR